jgi:hypothetical protein
MQPKKISYMVELFKTYPIITKKPIRLCVEEVQIDDQYIEYDGDYEEFEHGIYEMCTIKAGSPLWVSWTPAGHAFITQQDGGMTCIETEFEFGKDFDFDYSKPHLLPAEHKPTGQPQKQNVSHPKPKGPKR